MRIETASGHTILADDADYPLLWKYTWYASKCGGGRLYAHARVPRSGKRISMHRLLMNPPTDLVVHHKNNNGLDNRRSNLQVTTTRVNIRHAHEGIAGHHLDKKSGRWRSTVRDETGNRISLGMYDTEEQARAVVQNWNYRKMLELEAIGTAEALHLAEVIENNLTLPLRRGQ